MKAVDLKYLAGVTELARLEFASPRLTLYTTVDTLTAQYSGAYSSGSRWVARDGVPDLEADVESMLFRHFAATFADDATVRIGRTGSSLTLKSDGASHQLRCFPSQGRLLYPEDFAPFATCDAAKLLDEVDLAADLATQNTTTRGATGINLTTNTAKQWLRLAAFDGSGALFLAQVDCDEVTADVSLVLPAQDFHKGVALFAGGPVQLGTSGGRLAMRSDRAVFTAPTESVAWPDYAALLKKHPTTTVTFTSDQLRTAASSARVLGAAAVLEIEGSDGGVVLRTLQSEAGAFATVVAGTTFDGTICFSVSGLLFASKLGKDAITIELGHGVPATIRTHRRRLTLVPRAI